MPKTNLLFTRSDSGTSEGITMIETIKQTQGFCPQTLSPISMEIVKEGDQVFATRDSGLSEHKHLLESSFDFYNCSNVSYAHAVRGFDKIMVDVTNGCNLECPVCYRNLNRSIDPSFEELKVIAGGYKNKIISICGGEPTTRKDLAEIIALFSRRNTVFLITNGIKLADYDYLSNLKRHGLEYVSFSLNALNEEALSKMNGPGLLKPKLQALENLKKLRIKTILATVLASGVNERELSGLLEFCLKHRDFIQELRIRAISPFGKFLNCKRICLSEMIKIVSDEFKLRQEDLFKEYELKRIINQRLSREFFTVKSCSFDFHLNLWQGKITAVGSVLKDIKASSWLAIIRQLLHMYGMRMFIAGFLKQFFAKPNSPWIHSSNLFKIGLRVWPDIHTLDLNENKRCRTGYLLNGKVVSFCQANIIREKLGI